MFHPVRIEKNLKKELFDLSGCTAIVTGAGRGNGLGIANGLYAFGAKIYAVDLHHPEPVEDENFFQITGNVCDQKLQAAICERAYSGCEETPILVNNAGITKVVSGKYPKEAWDETIEVNLTAVFGWNREAAEHMKKMKRGSIINISSLGATLGFPDNPAYVASKGGLRMMTKAYARDLGKFGVRANNIAPGYMLTDMTRASFEDEAKRKQREASMMIKRWGTPEDLVGACVFLASKASEYITGQDINVDGGWTANGLV